MLEDDHIFTFTVKELPGSNFKALEEYLDNNSFIGVSSDTESVDFDLYSKKIFGGYFSYWPNFEDDMCEISELFPNLLFTVNGIEDGSFNKWRQYFLNGKATLFKYAAIIPFGISEEWVTSHTINPDLLAVDTESPTGLELWF